MGWDWNTNSTKIRTQTNIVVSLLCSYFSHWCCVESNGVRIFDCLIYEHSSNLNVVKLLCYFRIRMEGLLNLIHDLKCFTYSPELTFLFVSIWTLSATIECQSRWIGGIKSRWTSCIWKIWDRDVYSRRNTTHQNGSGERHLF